jgi:hypothetical protein
MKFRIETSGSFYSEDDAEKLKKLGFTFEKDNFYPPEASQLLYKTGGEVFRDIGTLEELMSFVSEWGGTVILTEDEIEIYDHYRE